MKSSVLIFLGFMSNKLLVNRDKILNFLRANYDKGYCDDCLSARLEIYPRQQVNQICRQLYATKSIFRNIGTCTSCGRDKIINIAKAHIQTEVKSQAVIKENQIVQNVSHWDKSLEWFWEGNVLEKIVEYMINVRIGKIGPVAQYGWSTGLRSRRSRVQVPAGPPKKFGLFSQIGLIFLFRFSDLELFWGLTLAMWR